MNHESSDVPFTVDSPESFSSWGMAVHVHQIAWARDMAPLMVNEAVSDATSILMTLSVSGQR